MEPLLLVGYTAVFIALVVYTWHLRSRLTTLERRLGEVDSTPEDDDLSGLDS